MAIPPGRNRQPTLFYLISFCCSEFFRLYQHIAQVNKYGYGNNEENDHTFSKNLMDKKKSANSTIPMMINITVMVYLLIKCLMNKFACNILP